MGRIFNPLDHKLKSHSQVPTYFLKDEELFVYFSSRNEFGQSEVYLSKFKFSNDIFNFIQVTAEPIMSLGSPGSFDDNGIMPGSVLLNKNRIFMYYTGWNARQNGLYHNTIGVAESFDGGESFTRIFPGPILDRTKTEPYMCVTPHVQIFKDTFHMWYVSGTKWVTKDEKYNPVYVIKHATSSNGFDWSRENISLIPQTSDEEALAHPSVIFKDNLYHMWYSFRSSEDFRGGSGSYRIGYATSVDNNIWNRSDYLLEKNEQWEINMQCYPEVFKFKDRYYMLYNGNGFGQSGFGICEIIF